MSLTTRHNTLPPPTPADPKRWLALGVIAISQLMIVLDASIVNIALPSAQRALHISTADRQWVVTAYTLAFGGLLLLGGRVADYLGRKRVFVVGLIGFATASAIGGLAPNSGALFGARALQGAFAALMAPAALSLISVTFTETRERARAFGVYGAISGGGAAIGLIAGGVLTEFASWRWCLLVNVPVAVLAAVAALYVVRDSRPHKGQTHYDLPGAFTTTLGLVALVYAFTKAETGGWASGTTLIFLAVAAVLLVAFVALELRSDHPLLPLRVVLDRNRGGSYLTSLLVGLALFGMFLFLTYYMQGTLHYSALRSGIAFLPFSVGIIVSATVAAQLLPRLGPRSLMVTGMIMATIGLALLTQIGVHTGYLSHILPSEMVTSVGMGLVFVPLSSTALIGVDENDAGVASALVNTTQQVGGSLGTALLNTLAATATATYLTARGSGSASKAAAVVHGYSVAFTLSAVLLAVGAITAFALVRAKREDLPAVDPAMAVA
ncbi:MAG TPA: MFS transporter [Acidimicrobiales bacterium]|jgi:EmrB/QacA subfamily drug resistance transporter|nr:MFS transporter [Acidimicrobiales bacterium]